jgi:hypothetical protein
VSRDRRGAARFVALAAAALAVAGTSASPPPPPPVQPLAAAGSVRVTAEHPVAIQPIVFSVGQGTPVSMTLVPHLGDASTQGTYLASVEPLDQTMSLRREAATGLATDPAEAEWAFDCRTKPCAARFALVVTWLDAPAGGASDVPWSVDANVAFVGSATAGATPGTVSVEAPSDDPTIRPLALLSSLSSGPPVRLSEADRFRSWTVRVAPSGDGATAHGWPLVTQARLSLSATQVAGEPLTFDADGNPTDRRALGRSDPPVQIRLRTSDNRAMTGWANGRPIEFDPFGRCPFEEPCETTLAIDVAWSDGRPDTSFDATWRLDLVSVDAAGGEKRPLTATVEALDPVHIATATSSGSFEHPGPLHQPQVRFSVDAPALRPGDGIGVMIPGRARATVTATSVGRVPLPADAVISVFADGASYLPAGGVLLKPGETGTFAFELRGLCGNGLARCAADGTLGGIIYSPNSSSKDAEGMVVRIDWSIDAGIGTTADGTAAFALEPQPTRAP